MSEHEALSAEHSLERSDARRPTIVGIGTSAGGLQALKHFFAGVPPDSDLSYVVVIHLASDHESHLADLLQPHASIPVTQVRDTTPLERNHVYVIPPDHNLSAIDSHLRLTPLESNRRDRAPVDHFFRTLAESFDARAVAVILTGTGSDGALGIRRIRERGGIVIAQDPSEAEFDGMPRSALDSGVVDIVLPVAEMPRRILQLMETRPRVTVSPEPERTEGTDADLLPRVLTWVRTRTGHEFARYKRTTVERRVARRMQLLGVEDPAAYLELLRESQKETAALADDLLINVTSFFRDRAVFAYLERTIVPDLFEGRGPTSRLRVWSVGSATGEEAYSLGMLLLEEAARRAHPPEIQIFATDLHERSLRHAREGLYPENIATEVSPERLERFFQQENDGYRVRKELRERVVFAPHNLLRDPPFSHIDLIACRNVLIYLQRDVQDEVMEVFHYSLHGEGYLLLGTAEMVDRSDLFRLENKEHHVYRRRNVAGPHLRLPHLPLAARTTSPAPITPRPDPAAGYGALHQQMVERYAPPSLLVDAEHNIVHLSEHAGRYLQVPGGLLSANVFKLVREELRTELRAALLLAQERQTTSRSKAIPIRIDGEIRNVVLRVSPTGGPETDGLALVIFDEAADTAPANNTVPPRDDETVRELEAELEMTRARLQGVVEEFESSQEEMRASNEELQSANEELRSTLEELETSREELQSINEELQTVNQENRHKVEELSQLSSDLQNLLKVSDIATLFLDRGLRINRATPRVADLFNIRHSDRGRPLSDLTHRLGYDSLLEDAQAVLETLIPVEREVETEDGRWFLIRVMPYRTVDDRIDGVVITFVDVTALKRIEQELRDNEARLEARVAERTAERDELRRALTQAEEEERQRLARELHDEAGQRLTAIGLGLQALSDVVPAGSEADRRAEQLRSLADTLARELHALAVRLRPKALDDFGLEAALAALAEEWSGRSGIAVDVHAATEPERLSSEIESAVYRIVQEALVNVAKHSGAQRASVVVERRDGSVVAIIEDDGKGFEVGAAVRTGAAPQGGGRTMLGLLGIRERAALLGGEVEVESTVGKGTTVFVRIPIGPSMPAPASAEIR